jgi:hypothetical protein
MRINFECSLLLKLADLNEYNYELYKLFRKGNFK